MEVENFTVDDTDLESVAKSLLVGGPDAKVKEDAKTKAAVESIPKEPNTPDKENEKSPDPSPEDEESSEEREPNVVPEGEDEVIDPDTLELEVQVDGETKKVTLKDLKTKYAAEGAIEKRLQEATEARTIQSQIAQQYQQGLVATSQKLQQLDQILKTSAEPQIDWARLRETDPSKYLLEREKQREAADKRNAIALEQQRINQEHQRINEKAIEDYTVEETNKTVAKIPALANPETRVKAMTEMINTAKKFGYTDAEINSVTDHRVFLVLNELSKLSTAEQARLAKQVKAADSVIPVKALLRPGTAAKPAMDDAKKRELSAYKAAKASGKVEDVAKFLMVSKKKA